MGFIKSLFWGGVAGTAFWAYLDERTYNMLVKNVAHPLQKEVTKETVELNKMAQVVRDVTINTFEEASKKKLEQQQSN